MIAWPDETKMKREGREGLHRFRETALAAELEASPDTWRITFWPWTSEPPIRIGLTNGEHRSIIVALGDDDIWLVTEDPHDTLHVRPPEVLEREAWGPTEGMTI
jgi:hypothetical protein